MARARKATVVETGPIEGPWVLPDGWEWRQLGSAGQWGSGGTPSAKNQSFYGGGIPWFRSGELNDGYLGQAELTLTDEGFNQSSAKMVKVGAVLVAMYGATVGKLAITREECTTNQAIAFCEPDASSVEARYLFYYLLRIRKSLKEQAQGGAQPNISQQLLKAQPFPVPPLDIQRRIVARIDELFSELDDGEAALARARADLETYRKSLLKAAVTGELTADWRAANSPSETGDQLLQRILADRKARWEADPKNNGKSYKEPVSINDRELAELPFGWGWASLDQLVSEQERSFQSGPFGSSLLHSEFQATGKLVIGIDNVQAGWFSPGSQHRISDEKYRELVRYKARPEDVLITVMATIGRSCVVPHDIEDAIITKHIYRMTIDCNAALPSFVECCFRGCPLTLRDIHGNVQGQTRPGLNKGILQRVAIPVPPMREQEAILQLLKTEGLSGLSSDQVKAASLTSEQLRLSILAAAFRGELVQ